MFVGFGAWRPDSNGLNSKYALDVSNVVPAASGFGPMRASVAVADALAADCMGAATVRDSQNFSTTVAGTGAGLYKLASGGTWTDVTRLSGGAYSVGSDDRWKFEAFGDTLIGVNGTDAPQALELIAGTNFAALGGSPPIARHLATVGPFVMLGNVIQGGTPYGNRVQWCDVGNATNWGSGSADYQDLYFGGPVSGLAGGETGFIFQYSAIRRAVYAPGTAYVFQIDVVERNRGCVAPHSLVQAGHVSYFLGQDGFYQLDQGAARTTSIDTQKVQRWWKSDVRTGTELNVIGGLDPINHRVFWAYISTDNPGSTPDKLLIYDWSLGEWAKASVRVQAFVTYVGNSYTMETLDAVGDLDSLPYSLDSAYWSGGVAVAGLVNRDRELCTLTGSPLAATIETNDQKMDGNKTTYIGSAVPEIDTTSAQVAIGAADRHGDSVVWGEPSGIEDTGETHQHVDARYIRAKMTVDAGAEWTIAHGLDVIAGGGGGR